MRLLRVSARNVAFMRRWAAHDARYKFDAKHLTLSAVKFFEGRSLNHITKLAKLAGQQRCPEVIRILSQVYLLRLIQDARFVSSADQLEVEMYLATGAPY